MHIRGTHAMDNTQSLNAASLLRLFCVAVVLLALLGSNTEAAYGQRKDDLKEEKTALKQARAVEKSIDAYEKSEQKRLQGRAAASTNNGAQLAQAVQNLSLRNFVRGGLATGNLIQVPYVTNVNVSAGYWGSTISPILRNVAQGLRRCSTVTR